MDTIAPSIISVTGIDNKILKSGDIVNLEVKFDEPIRFADDSAAHDDLFVYLTISGISSDRHPKAMLKKLDKDTLYFTYTVPSNTTDLEQTITGVDFSPLMQECNLSVVFEDESFTLSTSGLGNSSNIGYTRATSYITDIAGNGMKESDRMHNVTESYIDTKAPVITKINTAINANNSDVKRSLGSTDADNSDIYLGVGDSIKYGLTLSEVLDIEAGEYTGITAETNIKDQSGQPVTLTSTSISKIPTDDNAYGHGPSNGNVTYIDLGSLIIEQGMECTDNDGIIRIKNISLGNTIYDLAKNKLTVSSDDVNNLNTTTAYLDVEMPQIIPLNNQTGGVHPVVPYEDKSGFYFPFEITDNMSGTNGLTATFKWNKGSDTVFGNMYEYAVTSSADMPSEWKAGHMNLSYSFDQVEGTQYLHIKKINGSTYELLNTSLSFTIADYAGNKYTSSNPVTFNIDAVWDNTYPYAALGEVSKNLSAAGGTMKVSVKLTENTALNEAHYLWTDTNDQPSADAINEVPEGDIYNLTEAEITITQSVANGEDFNKYLWIKVSDKNGNEIVYNLGRQRYNLGTISYEINKSENYSSEFYFEFSTNEQDGYLFALHPVPDTSNEYYACVSGKSTNESSSWYKVSSDDKRTFSVLEKTDKDNEYLEDYLLNADNAAYSETFGYRNADLVFYIISGTLGAFTFDNDGRVIQAGNTSYPVSEELYTVRTITPNPDGQDFYPDMQITTEDNIPTFTTNYYYHSEEEGLSTLAGLTFNIDLGNDISGWDYDAIDLDNSYFEVYIAPNKYSDKYKLSRQRYQSFTLPEADYPTGMYGVGIVLRNKNNDTLFNAEYENIYVDSRTAPDTETFGIDYLKFNSNQNNYEYYYKTGISEQIVYPNNDIIYLPTSNNDSDYIQVYTSGSVHEQTGITGFYYNTNVLLWNVTAGQTEDLAAVNQSDYLYIQLFDEEGAKDYINNLDPDDPANKGLAPLCLIKNTTNIIAVRLALANGEKSEIKYYSIYPSSFELSEDISTQINDDGSLLRNDSELIYTPAQDQSMEGIRIYAASDIGDKKELLPQADGTYRCNADPGTSVNYFHAVNSYGSVYYFGTTIKTTRDNEAPKIIYSSSDESDGSYIIKFKISDMSLKEYQYNNPIDLKFTFDEEYSKRLGYGEGQQAHFELSIDEDIRVVSVNKDYRWEANDISNTGIYKIEARRSNTEHDSYLNVTVYGTSKYVPAENEDTAITFNLTVEATDIFGYTGSEVFENITVTNTKPHVVNTDSVQPEYKLVYNSSEDYALTLVFNIPVRPEKSWILPEPEGYKQEWSDGFPVTKDGITEISFYDIFGTFYTQDIELVDVFGEYGLDLTISPETYTKEFISITARLTDENTEKAFMFWHNDFGGNILQEISGENGESLPTKERTIKRYQNGKVIIYVYPRAYSADEIHSGFTSVSGDKLTIYLDNMVDGAPEAQPRFYLDQFGEEYTEQELLEKFPDGIATTGNVEVWYKTSRNVRATDNTNDRVKFTYLNTDTSYLFKYVDDFGNEGSLEIDLEDYGITLSAPPEPYKDESHPTMVFDIYAKLFNCYSATGAFSKSSEPEAIKEEFDNIGYVQGYSLKIGVTDYSSYKIVVLKNEPSSLTYSGAKSDEIAGVSIAGNTVTITKDINSDLTIATVDNASTETPAASDNFSYVTIKAEDLKAWFDTTKPTAEQKIVQNGLYEQIAYVRFADTSDDGTQIDSSTVTILNGVLDKETSGEYAGWYKKVFTDNTSSEIIFQDHVGNLGESEKLEVSGIDTEAPTITTTWTPPYVSASGEMATGRCTEKTVNTSVYAHMTANKAIDVDKVKLTHYTYDDWDWIEVPSGDINDIPDCNAAYSVNTEGITVCFEQGGIGLRFEIPAPNGKIRTADVYLPENIIDKVVPTVQAERTEIIRNGFSTPYAVNVKMTPDKSVYCTNYGTAEKLYNGTMPLELTITQNGTYEYFFVDKAGNNAVVSFTVDNIDRIAPQLTFTPDPADMPLVNTEQKITVTTDEDCTLTFDGKEYSLAANGSHELTFSKNGVYTVIAVDAAGNESIFNIPVGNIDTTPPNISFDSETIRIRQDSDKAELTAALKAGVTAWEPENQNIIEDWTYDASAVDLKIVGIYKVIYTVEDKAKNVKTAVRYVSVYDKNNPGIYIDGTLIEPEGTTVINSGEHEIKVDHIQEIAAGVLEPYTVKISKGISTIGQVKFKRADVDIDSNGKFTITPGFYTVSVITQSRKTFRAILYVEK